MKAGRYVLAAILMIGLIIALFQKDRSKQDGLNAESSQVIASKAAPLEEASSSRAVDEGEKSIRSSLPRLWKSPSVSCTSAPGHVCASCAAGDSESVKGMIRSGAFDSASFADLGNFVRGDELVLPLFDGEQVTGKVNLVTEEDTGFLRIGGQLAGTRKGTFSLGQRNGEFYGTILLPEKELAYTFAASPSGQALLQEKHISSVICYPLPWPENEPATAAIMQEAPGIPPPVLSSRPTAVAVLYLDFDGETVTDPFWNGGNTIVAQPSSLNNEAITEAWQRMKEDFWPFDIDVTTDVNRYNNAPVGSRMRCIITPTKEWYGSAGGVAGINSFQYAGTVLSATVPCWVFIDSTAKNVAEAVSHEFGHTLGLYHDGRISPAEGYYQGHGNGLVGWAPIMGVGYYEKLSQWSKGEYLSANNQEDDLAIIGNAANGFGLVADDVGDTRPLASYLSLASSIAVFDGIISGANDVDFFAVDFAADNIVTIDISPAAVAPNLDIRMELQDASGNVLAVSNPDLALDAAIETNGLSGTYYIMIQGTGRGNVLGDGYSDYGSMGHYSLDVTLLDVVADFPLDTDPGWTTEGQWAYGVPLGGGGYEKDPTSGFSGANVYGYNLAGDYADNIPQYWLTTTPIDCSGHENVELQFMRWLGVESATYDHADIEVSNDGTTWSNIWSHTGASIDESAWLKVKYDISSVADGQPTVFIRWGMGLTDGSQTHPGWNIDDVRLTGTAIDPVVHAFTMDTDPGWSAQGDWEFGQATGTAGNPASAFTGNNVYGYDLDGVYADNMPAYWLTTTALDCSGSTNILLKFQRWLGVDSPEYDQVSVEVSNDGSSWHTVWTNDAWYTETNWTEVAYDISDLADGQPTVYIRWGMGETDGYSFSFGWNIDDVVLESSPLAGDGIIYVSNEGSHTFPYVTWETAATNIQDAVSTALDGHTVMISNGTYVLNAEVVVEKAIRITSLSGRDETIVDGGGAVRCFDVGSSHSQIDGITLQNGYTLNDGGGVLGVAYYEQAIVSNCVVRNCRAYTGAGLYGVHVYDSVIENNIAEDTGGGLYHCIAHRCLVFGNTATSGGGVYGGSIWNCEVVENTARYSLGAGMDGGQAYSSLIAHNTGTGLSGVLAHNCTITRNTEEGAEYGTIANCIVYYNNDDAYNGQVYDVVSYNSCAPDLEHGLDGNITNAPLLVSHSHIATNSPCRGAAGYTSGTDIDGEPWLSPASIGCDENGGYGSVVGGVSMELLGPLVLTPGTPAEYKVRFSGPVTQTSVDFGDGAIVNPLVPIIKSWSIPGDVEVVLFATNDEYPNGVATTQTVSVVSGSSTAIHVSSLGGNDANDGSSWSQAKASIQSGVDAQQAYGGLVLVSNGTYNLTSEILVDTPLQVVAINGPEETIVDGGNLVRCFNLGDTASEISGFTLQNGFAPENGGGIYCDFIGGDAVITNCIITGCRADIFGGGIYSGLANDCVISNNYAQESGGGLARSEALNCTITDNSAGYDGGGAYYTYATGCLTVGNVAENNGGGHYFGNVINCTVVDNVASNNGGGTYSGSVANSIIWYNHASLSANDISAYNPQFSCSPDLTHNGNGNITNAPLFVDRLNGDYRLLLASPCIDAGQNSFTNGAPDLDGNPRIGGLNIDMGVFEFVYFNHLFTSQNTYLGFANEGSSPTNDALGLWSSGESSLTYTITSSEPWVSIVPITGTSTGELDVVAVQYATSSLQQGTHYAQINISVPDASNNPIIIPVEVTIYGPVLATTPTSRNIQVAVGNSPSATSVGIYNAGVNTLDYTLSSDASWLTPGAATGSSTGEVDSVSLNLDTETLPLGLHTGIVTIASSNATNGPHQVEVVVDVYEPVLDHFAWSLGNLQLSALGSTIQAIDGNGYPVPSFNGTVNLSAWENGAGLGEVQIGGESSGSWGYPMQTYYHDARTQVIYLSDEIGGATQISSLSLNVTSLPSMPMNDWTIRMRHTGLDNYPASPAWESDWTVVYQGDLAISSTGWVEFLFDTPFEFNGVSNLMVDFSFNNSAFIWPAGECSSTNVGASRAIYKASDSTDGDPLSWPVGNDPTPSSSTLIPVIRLGVESGQPVSITPVVTGSFVDGVWAGELAIDGTPTNLWLVADDGLGHLGSTNHTPIYMQLSTTQINGEAYWGYPVENDHQFSVWSSSSNSMGYSLASDVSWLELPVSNGMVTGETDVLSVTNTAWDVPDQDPVDYPEYYRTGTVSIVSAEAANSPLEMSVVYRWTEAPLGSLVWASAPSSVTDGQEFFVALQAKNIYGDPKQFVALDEYVNLQVIGSGVGLAYHDLSSFSFTDESSGTIILTGSGSATLHATVGSVTAPHFIVVSPASDSDSDGMLDSWEIAFFGSTNAFNGGSADDWDGDGLDNLGEFIAGTIPTNGASFFEITGATNLPAGFVLNWNAVTGRLYSVMWTGNLTNSFQNLETDLVYPQNSYTDTVHTAEDGGFYNLKVELDD